MEVRRWNRMYEDMTFENIVDSMMEDNAGWLGYK